MYNLDNFCVICGQCIPEGRMVCVNCELAGAKHAKKKRPHNGSFSKRNDLRKKRRDKEKQKDFYIEEFEGDGE